jgi:hypothetical protein
VGIAGDSAGPPRLGRPPTRPMGKAATTPHLVETTCHADVVVTVSIHASWRRQSLAWVSLLVRSSPIYSTP